MALKDFYQGSTKKFDIKIEYNAVTPNITTDEVMFYLKDRITSTDYILSQSADVTISGSVGVARFNLTPTITDIEPSAYVYEISWIISGSNETYVLDTAPIRVLKRVKTI